MYTQINIGSNASFLLFYSVLSINRYNYFGAIVDKSNTLPSPLVRSSSRQWVSVQNRHSTASIPLQKKCTQIARSDKENNP